MRNNLKERVTVRMEHNLQEARSQTPLPSLKAIRADGGGHRHRHRRRHHHHVILGFSMIGPNETLGTPRTVAARLRTTLPLGWVEFLGERESCGDTRYV